MENFRLRVFRAVARQLHFRRAAEELLLTQPAVTQQIHALEDELGAPLFDRSGGKVRLTAYGELLLPYADRLHRIAEEAKERVSEAAGATVGSLAVGASQTIGKYLLPGLVAGFLREQPRVAFTVAGGNTREMLEALRNRTVHLALVEGPAEGQDVQLWPFLEDRMDCVMPPGHAWAQAGASTNDGVPLEALRGENLLLREAGSGSRAMVERALREAGLPLRELRLGITFPSNEGVIGAVEAGLGVAFLSRWAVRSHVAMGSLEVARVQGLRIRRRFAVAGVAGPEPGGAAGHFLRYVLEHGAALTG